ncbi:hypothetical protein HB852_12540 [Listeria grandensis]|uniref:Uncharacterized protein n=2 Tax=Listeria grandensis TaxID=1494963 RepID=W7BJP2_9LIST|nr:hypothetical protein [Listeria grandensis]EUJ23421.1 hypothetical protein PGRAN_08669 [Listeria grandensis FSL F6-0971]MBC1475441.1 hypothetical protein [Listeria grandensis]MBC1936676.1 hypothetical protein [Listeria grandensis]MBC6316551.1 hypothetical protein [Listeria grandensis]
MKKLFDETHEHESEFYRTVWYGYVEGDLDEALLETIVSTVQSDLAQKLENPSTATHWVFYSGTTNKDAIDDAVRSSLMIREWNGNFVTNYNMSDFEFVTALDRINDYRGKLEQRLNA